MIPPPALSFMIDLKIFSNNQLSPEVLEILKEGVAPAEIVTPSRPGSSVLAAPEKDPAFVGVDIAFGQPDLESIYESETLRWVHISSAGFTRYDTAGFRSHAAGRGLIVTNSSSVYAEACAQHAFAFILAHARRLPESLGTRIANGVPEWNELRGACRLLQCQTLLILGYGTIAARLVEMLKPFNLEVVAMRRNPKGDEGIRIITPDALPEFLAKADHVVNIMPENAESLGFFDSERFAGMKKGSVFQNIGRGTTVDQTALHDALKSGHLDSAWLDVTTPEPLPDDHPLWTLKNCHITPHTAGGYGNESLALVRHFLANYQRFINSEPMLDRVM